MEKIIILSGCEGPDEDLVAYLGALFPGCTIEILQKDALAFERAQGSLGEVEADELSGATGKVVETNYH
jgi:hypothetical protein